MKLPKLSLLAAVIASYSSSIVFADNTPVLDEIVVTAQKRAQNQQDVPISLSTVSGEKLESAGVTSPEGLADYVPNFNMTQTGIGTNIAIRGISSGVNPGFEQSAAMFVDGIHYGRSQLARAPFLDISRIEVLRGPQSILFGKNSTAGAISIITTKPGKELEASLSALYEPEYGEKETRLILSGPISETVGGRMAIMSRKTDGYIENTTLNRNEAAEKNRVVRATLEWKPTDDWDITLKLEDGSFDSNGRNIEVSKPVFLPYIPVKDAVAYSNMLAALTSGKFILDSNVDGKRQSNGDYSYNDTNNVTLTVDRNINDLTLTSVTGYNAYSYQELCDCDFIGTPIFNIASNEEYKQVSQELRLASPETQKVSWLGGLFYQGSTIDFRDSINVPADSTIIGKAISPALLGASTKRKFGQDTSLYAGFLQTTWNISDSNRLILGGRYTQETKDANRHLYHVKPDGTVLAQGSPTDPYNLLWSAFGIDPHEIKGKRDESGFNPQVTYQFDLNKHDHLYASYTTGFKSGGFDVRSNSAPDTQGGIYTPLNSKVNTNGSWEFQTEKAKNYEVGGKFVLADGAAELNVAIFRSEFSNMQTSQFDGKLSFNVTNAGEAVVQGLEVDGRWAITDDLQTRVGASTTDFNYTKFPNSQCYFGQVDNIGAVGDGVCDATGKSREFVPKYQGNIGADYNYYFSNSWKLANSLDVIYSDSYLTTPSLDPKFVQPSYTKINARIALSGVDGKWELALIGKNLTDKSVVTYANGLPFATVLTGGKASGYYAFYGEPRSIAVQGTVKF